jgi:Ca-activated chloride channel family protein
MPAEYHAVARLNKRAGQTRLAGLNGPRIIRLKLVPLRLLMFQFCQPIKSIRTLLLVMLAIIALMFPLRAQQSDSKAVRERRVFPKNEQVPDEVLKIDTDLVSVDVRANDAEGRPLRNLRQEDFRVYLDGSEQPLAFFQVERRSGEPRPLAMVFALDISGSMTQEEMTRLRSALNAFSEKLSDHPALYAVMSFGMNVKTVQKFTSEADKLDRAFERVAREPNGLSTHTYDAVDDAIRLLVRHAPRTREGRLIKRAVLVVTDGFPVGDTVSASTVIERANAAEASIYVVTLPSYSRVLPVAAQDPIPTPLDVSGLADLTGGKSVYAEEKNYEGLFRALAEEVTSAYVLAFYPPEEKRHDGRFHTIKIEGPNGVMLSQSRRGFQSETKQ